MTRRVAYARALERLAARRASPAVPVLPNDYLELSAVFGGPHPETGEELVVEDGTPEGAPAFDLPSQPAVFAPDYASEEIAQIAEKLRTDAGLSKAPSGEVAQRRSRGANGSARRRKAASSK